jgi:hypothetical protein
MNEARRPNDRVAVRAMRLRFVSGIPFICECGDPACRLFVVLSPEEYRHARREGLPLLSPKHASTGADEAAAS